MANVISGYFKCIIRRQTQPIKGGTLPQLQYYPPINGWTATYYVRAGTYADAVTAIDSINTAEMALLAPDTITAGYRISDPGIKGDVVHAPATTTAGSYVGGAPTDYSSVDPSLSVPVTVNAGPLYRANRWLRGVNEDITDLAERAKWTPPLDWIQLYNAYGKALQADAVHLLIGVDPSGNKTFTGVAITDLTPYVAGKTYNLSIRRVGRPFDLPRGRKATC